MQHPTIEAAIIAEFEACHRRAPGFATVSANALATAAMRALTEHVGGPWHVVRNDGEGKARAEIFYTLTGGTFPHENEIEYRGQKVNIVAGIDGAYLDVLGYTLFPRRRQADNRDHIDMIRDLDLLLDILDGSDR
jgi:hypothetical protein